MPEDLSGNLPIFDIRWVYGAEEGGCAPIDWRGSPPSARGSGPTPGGYPEPPKDQIFLSSAFHPKSFDIFDNFLPKSAQNGRCFWEKKNTFRLGVLRRAENQSRGRRRCTGWRGRFSVHLSPQPALTSNRLGHWVLTNLTKVLPPWLSWQQRQTKLPRTSVL